MRNRDLVPLFNQPPFAFMRRFTDDLDRMFEELNLRRRAIAPELPAFDWAPAIELVEKDGIFFVKADLPGLTKEEVKIDVNDNILTLTGERKIEKEEKEKGVLKTERFYGSFYREVVLPEGAKPEAAKATFKNGVLEIEVPLEVKKPIAGRRVPILEAEAKPEKFVEQKKELVGA